MSEPIFKRMQRVVSAGLDSATSAAERLNSAGVMRRSLREVEQAIDALQKRQDAAKARATQADVRRTGTLTGTITDILADVATQGCPLLSATARAGAERVRSSRAEGAAAYLGPARATPLAS